MRLAVLALMTAWSCGASAEPSALRGAGSARCAEAVADSEGSSKSGHDATREWVWGFISGFQFFSQKPYDLTATDAEAAELFLKNYCREHPSASYYEGIFQFVRTLPQFVPNAKR